jgi:hypothetical protein
MARPLRLEFTGALYHATSRGDRCEDIYEEDADRNYRLRIKNQKTDPKPGSPGQLTHATHNNDESLAAVLKVGVSRYDTKCYSTQQATRLWHADF